MSPDLLERLRAEFGTEAKAAAESFGDDLCVLTFQENRRGGDPVARTPDGRAVFPDKFRGGADIVAGDTWFCDVTSKGGGSFFAAPLKRLDAAFFLELGEAQLDRIIQVALEEGHEALDRRIAAAIQADVDGRTQGRIAELEAENVLLGERLAELEEQYEGAAARLAEQAEEEPESGGEAVQGPPAWRPLNGGHEARPATVDRLGPDLLSSPIFDHERYYGHVSPDGRRLFLKAHLKGNLPNAGGRLHIPGLERVSPFEGRARCAAHFDPRHGGWFVRL